MNAPPENDEALTLAGGGASGTTEDGNLRADDTPGREVKGTARKSLKPLTKDAILSLVWPMSPPVPVLPRPPKSERVAVVASTPDLARLRSALAAIPNDTDPLDYDQWRDVGFAIHYATEGSDEGLTLFHEFSARSQKYDPEFLDSRFWCYAGISSAAPITERSLFSLAEKHGWQDPTIADDFDVIEVPAGEHDAAAGRIGALFLSAREVLQRRGPVDWLIENLFESNAIGLKVGESQSYKSFLAIDAGLSIAAGRDWCGEKVKAGPVIYIAGEGHNGIGNRMAAWGMHRGVDVEALPFFLSARSVPLLDKKMAARVEREVKTIGEVSGAPRLVVVDTLGRNFGDGDESTSKDFYKFIEHIDRHLRTPFGTSVVIVHHTGHGDKSRARGSSSMRQGVDFEYLVEKQEHLTTKLTCQKMKDAPLSEDRFFRGQSLALDMEGTSSLVFDQVAGYSPPAAKTARMGKAQTQMLGVLRNLAEGCAGGWVHPVDWKRAASGAGVISDPNSRQRFYELVKSLQDRGQIEREGNTPNGNVRPIGWDQKGSFDD